MTERRMVREQAHRLKGELRGMCGNNAHHLVSRLKRDSAKKIDSQYRPAICSYQFLPADCADIDYGADKAYCDRTATLIVAVYEQSILQYKYLWSALSHVLTTTHCR